MRNTTSRDLEPYAVQCSKNGEPPGVHSLPDSRKNLVTQICIRMMVDILTTPVNVEQVDLIQRSGLQCR